MVQQYLIRSVGIGGRRVYWLKEGKGPSGYAWHLGAPGMALAVRFRTKQQAQVVAKHVNGAGAGDPEVVRMGGSMMRYVIMSGDRYGHFTGYAKRSKVRDVTWRAGEPGLRRATQFKTREDAVAVAAQVKGVDGPPVVVEI